MKLKVSLLVLMVAFTSSAHAMDRTEEAFVGSLITAHALVRARCPYELGSEDEIRKVADAARVDFSVYGRAVTETVRKFSDQTYQRDALLPEVTIKARKQWDLIVSEMLSNRWACPILGDQLVKAGLLSRK